VVQCKCISSSRWLKGVTEHGVRVLWKSTVVEIVYIDSICMDVSAVCYSGILLYLCKLEELCGIRGVKVIIKPPVFLCHFFCCIGTSKFAGYENSGSNGGIINAPAKVAVCYVVSTDILIVPSSAIALTAFLVMDYHLLGGAVCLNDPRAFAHVTNFCDILFFAT
jgi:hypothetical protein